MKKSEREEQLYFLTGMDQFNRSFSYLTDIREKKKVGMFFWLWIGQPYAAGAYDVKHLTLARTDSSIFGVNRFGDITILLMNGLYENK